MQINDILSFLDQEGTFYTFIGSSNAVVNSFCPLKDLRPESMTWVRSIDRDICYRLNQIPSILAFCDVNQSDGLIFQCNAILVENPHRTFFRVLMRFFYHDEPHQIAGSAVIESDDIGKSLSCGHFSFIGKDVRIGDDCYIGNNVTIEGKVTIGDRVRIDSGCRIGVSGFGHYINEDGTITGIPHLGGVQIGSDTRIGANSVVAAGTLGPTILGDFVMVDGLCYIAHNASVGNRVFVTGGSGVAGSAVIEDDVWISPRCVINSSTTVGRGAFIAMGSIVTKDVPPDQYVCGAPAVAHGPVRHNKYKI